jgi:hypothetical protein
MQAPPRCGRRAHGAGAVKESEGAPAGVVYDVTEEYDVPLMVTRGYPSLSYVHDAAEAIAAQGKPAYLYYFGDYDPSGVDIAEIHFERPAVNEAQIAEYQLPTRPTKATDSRAAKFGDDRSVELDALEPSQLRAMVRVCIEQHIAPGPLRVARLAEESERESLRMFARAAS